VPTYQYACTECDHAFEQFQSFTDDALTVCPQCSGRLRKVFNAVGVVFKGSGFYRTDSRSTKDDSAPAATSGDKGSGDKGSGDKGSGQGSGDKGAGKGAGEKSPAAASGSSSATTSASSKPATSGSSSAA
jgi:putative FmdB family regulatory protein